VNPEVENGKVWVKVQWVFFRVNYKQKKKKREKIGDTTPFTKNFKSKKNKTKTRFDGSRGQKRPG